jgi:hypothetical protein
VPPTSTVQLAQVASSSTPTQTATAVPTATNTPRPPTPTPTQTPFAAVAGVRSEPPPQNFLQTFPSVSDLSSNAKVVGTNLSMALMALLLILVATTVFNATLKENAAVIGGAVTRVVAPMAGLVSVLNFDKKQTFPAMAWIKPIGLLGATAVIYSGLDPHFGFNNSSLVLLVSLMAGLAMTTFLYEGGQVLLSSRGFGLQAVLRVYPLAILIAAVSVAFSRIVSLHPGVVFGFVASAALLQRGPISSRHQGLIVYLPMLGLLLVSLVALALVGPLRHWTEGSTSVWASMPETVAVAVFVGGAESVLFSMIPLTFNDGEKVWTWNRLAWLSLALPASFLFFHVVINRSSDFADISKDSSAIALLAGAAGLLVLAGALWLYFRIKYGSESAELGAEGLD